MVERMEFCRDVDLSEAAYWLAKASRENRRGMVATVAGADVYAWPHQTVDEIVRTHLRLIEAAPPSDRWTARRKVDLVDRVKRGLISREAAWAQFGIGADEWRAWVGYWEAAA